MTQQMGFSQPEWNNGIDFAKLKKKNWWLLIIPSISANGVNSLPPLKTNRPSLSFKEITAEHLNETISYPGKPEWKPITLSLYDLDKGVENPVFTWIRRQYDVKNCSYWQPCLAQTSISTTFVVPQVSLIMFNECGDTIETWVLEHVWPQQIEFGELDMANGTDVCMVDITLKYQRAYIETPNTSVQLSFPSVIPNFACGAVPPSFIPPSYIPGISNISSCNYSFMEPLIVEPVRKVEFKVERW